MILRIHLTAHWQDAASPCDWALLDDAGNMRDSGHCTLASMPQADDTLVILAADRVLSASAVLPKLKHNKLETALPYALEDALIDDAADSHVTPGEKLKDGRTILYTVNKGWLIRFLSTASSVKLRVRKVVPEYCLLPVRDHEWSLAWDGTQGFLAMTDRLGCALDSGGNTRPPVALQLRLAHEPPTALRLFALGVEMQPPDWALGLPVICEKQSFDWRRIAIPDGVPNLLWGKLAPPPRISEFWPWLRPALMAALLLFTLEAALSNVEWAMFAWEKRQLTRQMTEIFRETFGADATIVDAPLQMRRNVAHLRRATGTRDDADFLPLLEKFSAAAADATLRTLRYEDGKLDIEMTLAGEAALAAMRQRLSGNGLQIQITDTQETGSQITAQLRISAGGAQ
jgi:general secretion pathway protein L